MEYYSPVAAVARALNEIHIVEYPPPPDAYLLPPYQVNYNAFLTRSSLLSAPPLEMRGYGMPEHLWYWFEHWLSAPADIRPLLLHHAAVEFRMSWPRAPVIVKTPQQEAWLRSHPPREASTILQVSSFGYVVTVRELKGSISASNASSAVGKASGARISPTFISPCPHPLYSTASCPTRVLPTRHRLCSRWWVTPWDHPSPPLS